MPNGEATTFPQFPTQYTERERERLKGLEGQRKKLEEIYQAKFAPEAWAETPLVEKGVRELLPSWLSPVVRAVTPWEKGAWDYGFTPEQAQEYRFKVEEEYKGLARQEKVTRLLPDIQTGLMVAALSGEPITDITELISDFPELKIDFTEEEIGYLASLAQNLLHASAEDILSGKVFGYDPSQLPITEEDIESLAKQGLGIDPRFILSTVAFSKDLQEIGIALQQAYPPEVPEVEIDEGLRQRLFDYFRQRAIELGIRPEEGKPIKDTIKNVHEKIAEKEGEILVLTNEQTGEIVTARKRPDGTVWSEDGEELLGYYDKEQQRVVPIALATGQPLLTDEAQESQPKDLWKDFYFGLHQAWYGTRQAILGAVPAALLLQFRKFEEWTLTHRVDKEVAEHNIKATQDIIESLRVHQDIREAEHKVWLEEHPELTPKLAYTLNPIEHTELFRDPYWYGYIIASNAPVIGAALFVGIATSIATKNPWAGAGAGAAIITPVQINSVYEDLIANGASHNNATELATSVGTLMGAVEVIPGMIVLKAASPVFMRLFRQNLQKELTKQVVTRLSVKGILTTAGKIEVAETLEEVVQESMQNAAVKTVNENRSILENLPQTAIHAAIATAPLAMFGGGATYLNMKSNLSKATQDEIDTTAKKLKDAGLSDEHAEAVAFTKVIESEKGQAEVEVAAEKARDEIPSPSKILSKVADLEGILVTINEDVDVFNSSIPIQEERLAKMKAGGELPSEQMAQFGKIKDMKETLVELQDRRTKLLAQIKKLNKATEPKATLPAPEVIETGKEYTATVYRGAKPGVAPVDEGLFGKGTYYASSHEYAETYGEVTTSKVSLKKPFVISSQQEYDDFQGKYRDMKQEELNKGKSPSEVDELVAVQIRKDLEGQGYDGLIARNIIAKGEEVVVFHPEKAVSEAEEVVAPEPEEPTVPETIPEALVVPDPDVGRELSPDGRPRLKDWADDQVDTAKAVKGTKAIFSHIVLNKEVREARIEAERTLEGLHSRLEAAETEEEKKAVGDEFKDLAGRSGLNKKRLLASHWKDLTPPEQASLALATVPDKSISFSVKRELFDIRYYMQFLEEKTGLPFHTVFKRAELSHGGARIAQEQFLRRIGGDPNFTHIRTDEAALVRVTQEINARNPRVKVEHPEGLADQELLLANVIEEMYKHYEPKVRYLRFMRVAPNMDSLKTAFPDALETELSLALEIRNMGKLDDLYSLLEGFEWGVINSGYDPWMVSLPSLIPARTTLGTTRGASRLMRRDTVEFPQGMERNVLLRLATYMKQVEAQWWLEPELDVLEGLWSQAGDKIANAGQVESALREWTRELQGIPTRQSFLDSVLRRVWRQAMSAVFLHPWMAYRNFHQHIAFHPYRTELARLITQEVPVSFKEKMNIYFDGFVSQLKGIRRDWLYTGERGLPGLEWLTRLSDSMSLYAHSDNVPRRWSFQASTNKAMRATEQYQRDGDVGRWLKQSGALHLRQTQRNYALELLAQPTFDLAVPGLKSINGGEMASLYIGHETASNTHFIYERAFRAPVELGATGRTIYNLIVFPRGYFQRVYFQAQKLPNLKEVFSPETNWEEARAGFKDLVLLTVVGIMVSEWIKKVTGRPRRAYNPADIFQWQLGGLIIGVGMDLTKMVSDVVVALDPTVDPEHKADVLGRLPGELIRSTDVLVPFYRNLIDSIEASTDTANIDVQMLRKLRALIDEKYTPEEIETIDRSLWEKLRKAVLAGEPPDPTVFRNIQESLIEAQARLGEMDATGRFYTLRQFAGDIKALTKPLPDDMLTENYNFSDLVIFYKECEDSWEELYKIKSSPARLRQEWRKDHVEEEAMLLFWGMYSIENSVFLKYSPEWNEVRGVIATWFSLYGIDYRMHPDYADWTIPPR